MPCVPRLINGDYSWLIETALQDWGYVNLVQNFFYTNCFDQVHCKVSFVIYNAIAKKITSATISSFTRIILHTGLTTYGLHRHSYHPVFHSNIQLDSR